MGFEERKVFDSDWSAPIGFIFHQTLAKPNDCIIAVTERLIKFYRPIVGCSNLEISTSSSLHMSGEEAGGKMVGVHFFELRFTLAADFFGIKTTRMKAAAGRRIDRTGDITF